MAVGARAGLRGARQAGRHSSVAGLGDLPTCGNMHPFHPSIPLPPAGAAAPGCGQGHPWRGRPSALNRPTRAKGHRQRPAAPGQRCWGLLACSEAHLEVCKQLNSFKGPCPVNCTVTAGMREALPCATTGHAASGGWAGAAAAAGRLPLGGSTGPTGLSCSPETCQCFFGAVGGAGDSAGRQKGLQPAGGNGCGRLACSIGARQFRG